MSQDTSTTKLLFNIHPTSAIVRFDTTRITKFMQYLDVPIGKHVVKSWAPKLKLSIDTITVHAGKNNIYGKSLSYSDGYRLYRKKMRRYHWGKFGMLYLPWIFIGASTVGVAAQTAITDTELDLLERTALDAQLDYQNASSAYQAIIAKGIFENNQSLYEQKLNERNNLVMGFGIAGGVVAIAGVAFLVLKKKLLKKPEYHEHKMLSQVEIFPQTNFFSNVGLGLNYRFN